MWSTPPNKDIINTKKMLKLLKNILESGTSCKCVYADILRRSEGKQVQFKLSDLKYRERK